MQRPAAEPPVSPLHISCVPLPPFVAASSSTDNRVCAQAGRNVGTEACATADVQSSTNGPVFKIEMGTVAVNRQQAFFYPRKLQLVPPVLLRYTRYGRDPSEHRLRRRGRR